MNRIGNRRRFLGLGTLALAFVSLGPSLRAQDQAPTSGPPARAVRLSYVDGQVKLSQGNQVLADQAVVNTPLFEGMQLTTADSGKAEIQFEDGSVARISPDSSLTLQVLRGSGTSADAELMVSSGLAYFEFQGGGQSGQMKVQFGNSLITTSGFTVFRVAMDAPPGKLAVFSGNAHLDISGGNSVDLHGGESIALNAGQPNHYDVAESIEPDSWDSWNSDRDQALTTIAAAQTGAPADLGQTSNPAWSDLDANGSWYDVPGQGYIWSPTMAANAGFDPYGNGNWMWTPGYGYLWASGYPWGYLPFQCGAWNFYDSFGWGWAPGMGGCSPWWGMGFYGGPNIGYAPPGYRAVPRPIVPRHPIAGRPVAIVAVNRPLAASGNAFPLRNRNTAVTIGGNAVRPLQPLPHQTSFAHPSTTAFSGAKPAGGQTPGARPGYTPKQPTPSAFRGAGPQNSPSGNRNSSSFSAPRGNSGGGNSPASHPSGGGSFGGSGGGGASRGGGGGGGASHGGGGGGGGGHK